MQPRSEQLQIRLTPQEKTALRHRARAAGQDLSAYVLALALPDNAKPFAELVDAVRHDGTRRFALAAINDTLAALAPIEFAAAVNAIDVRALEPVWQNYLAAMVEHTARTLRARAPEWTREITPLERPYFATSLRTLRRYLLRVSPVAFKRRNLFVDASVGARV